MNIGRRLSCHLALHLFEIQFVSWTSECGNGKDSLGRCLFFCPMSVWHGMVFQKLVTISYEIHKRHGKQARIITLQRYYNSNIKLDMLLLLFLQLSSKEKTFLKRFFSPVFVFLSVYQARGKNTFWKIFSPTSAFSVRLSGPTKEKNIFEKMLPNNNKTTTTKQTE